MAKKEAKLTTVLERNYNIPLRKEWLKAPRWKRTKKAVKAAREFLEKHMKSDNVKLGKHLNEYIWNHGGKNPPHHAKVNVTKDSEGKVIAELEGAPKSEVKEEKPKKGVEKKVEEAKKEEVKEEKKPEEKKPEPTKEEPKVEEKKEEPKKEEVKEEKKPEEKKPEPTKEAPKKEEPNISKEIEEKKAKEKEEQKKVEELAQQILKKGSTK